MKKAANGVTLDELKKQFGEPNSTTSSTNSGVKVDTLTWTNVEGGLGASVVVGFTDNHAFSKNITGFKFNRDKKITLADFNALANGTSYQDAVAKIGEPDGFNETLIGGVKTVIASYVSGVQGDAGANASLTFTNDKISGKTQTNMK